MEEQNKHSDEHQPEQPDSRRAWAPKDYLTMVLSIFALVVSAASAYFNFVRVEDNISLSVNFRAHATRTDQHEFSIPAKHATPVVFINGGNRPVAILSLDLIYVQAESGASTGCAGRNTKVFRTDFDVVVVKPNDFAVKRVNMADAESYLTDQIRKSERDTYLFPIWNGNSNESDISIEVCAAVEMTTPAEARYHKNIPLSKYSAQLDGKWSPQSDDSPQPQQLVRNVTTRFQ